MTKILVIRARVNEKQMNTVEHLCEKTGLNMSEVLRALIDSAALEAKPMPVVRRLKLPKKGENNLEIVHDN